MQSRANASSSSWDVDPMRELARARLRWQHRPAEVERQLQAEGVPPGLARGIVIDVRGELSAERWRRIAARLAVPSLVALALVALISTGP